jgi:hypothetical protein
MRRYLFAVPGLNKAGEVFAAQIEFHPPKEYAGPAVQVVGIGQDNPPANGPGGAPRNNAISCPADKRGISRELNVGKQDAGRRATGDSQ